MKKSTTPATGDEHEYSVESLTVLEGLDAVRKRPGMYIGSTDARGLQHCVWEIIDNAVDEALAGHCSDIEVLLHADGSAEVRDNGRGIPVDVDHKTGLSGVELVFTKLHAGGKFGGGGYAVSGGLHGVGASVVNALSTRVDVEVLRNGRRYELSFNRGVAGHFDAKGGFSPGSVRDTGKASRDGTGTTVRFWPDRQIFLAAAQLDFDATLTRARQTAFLVPALRIVCHDLRGADPVVEEFHFEGGMRDFVEYVATDRPISDTLLLTGSGTFTESVPVLRDDVLVTEDVERTCEVEVALRWGVGYETDVRSFVNIISTPKGGTHISGFERALVKAVVDGVKGAKLLKGSEESPIKDDIIEGITAVVLVRLAEPQFEGQTKEVLGTSAVAGIVAQVVGDGLRDWFADKKAKQTSKGVLDKVVNAARARRAARLQRETIRRKNALESSSLPAKLSDCRSDDMERAELFIIEGDSAGGTVKAARDSEFQALMPIRGKILNTMRASEKQMLDNTECAAIITAIGAGSGKSFDLSSIRYGKLIILADADVDGAHIRCLLLTLAYRYMRPLLEAGRIYAAVPPLYRIEVAGSKEYIYCYSDPERDEHTAKIAKAGKKIKDIQRYKGLGEMDADQLAETTLDVDQRKLRRMTMADAQLAEQAFSTLMGQDVSGRRDFIVANGGLLDRSRIDA
jgi:DNA gyrase subunit B